MKILLAEDEAQLNRVITVALEREGYSVDSVFNGQDAVEKATTNHYHLMIFDIMMPIKTGIEALKEIRQLGNTTHVIMLTAMAEVDDRVTGLDAGADDYLTKPFSLKELLARLRSTARRLEDYTPDTVQLGNTRLDIDEQELAATNSIRLGKKETQLLTLLIQHANQTLSCQQLLEQVWPDELDELDESDHELVFLYISYLRQKLQSVQSNLQILGSAEGPFQLIGGD